jgi:hypothetical protein
VVDVEAEEVTEASVGKAPSLPSSFPALDGIGPNDAVGMGPWRYKKTRTTRTTHHHSSIETDKKTTSQKKIKVSVFFALEKLKN